MADTRGPDGSIEKPLDLVRTANLTDYDASRAHFDWAATAGLDGLAGGGLNIAHEAVTRHARGGRARRAAFRFVDRDGITNELTYADLEGVSNRFAAVLAQLGVEAGERVFAALPRLPQLYAAALGTWKAGAVFCPLFSAFGPEPIRQRVELGRGAVLVTTAALYRNRVASIRDALPTLRHVLCAGELATEGELPPGTLPLDALLAAAPADPVMAATTPDDEAIIHFTSGTTGRPKGAVHVHGAVVAHAATARLALDLHDDDVFWCTADPGWVTGTSYGIIAPLVLGVTSVIDEAEFDAERWYGILSSQRVSVWYTAPTAVRMMMRLGADLARSADTSALRFIASVGEPLSAEAVRWGIEAFGLPIHDNWWQTETGGIMVANLAACPIRPGSMGRPLPGIEAGLLAMGDDGEVRLDEDGFPVEADDAPPETAGGPADGGAEPEGMLALRPGWPSMFRTYLDADERYRAAFRPSRDGRGWYLSGDLARRDGEGYYWFVARADDVIKTSGHLIGPFEVESVLNQHPSVAASGVFGKPHPTAGNIVKAVVVPRAGIEPTPALRRELIAHARRALGSAVAPRELDFATDLPLTRSGKIMRRLLRARELGLPEGDTSTLESPAPTTPGPEDRP